MSKSFSCCPYILPRRLQARTARGPQGRWQRWEAIPTSTSSCICTLTTHRREANPPHLFIRSADALKARDCALEEQIPRAEHFRPPSRLVRQRLKHVGLVDVLRRPCVTVLGKHGLLAGQHGTSELVGNRLPPNSPSYLDFERAKPESLPVVMESHLLRDPHDDAAQRPCCGI